MTLGSLTNLEIDQILHNIPGYKGTWSDDDIPLTRNRPNSTSYYIVNLQHSSQRGSHWCLIIEEKNRMVYLDPYGVVPDKDTLKWIKTRKKPLYYSKYDLQALSSNRCGFFCMYFILNHAGRKGRKNFPRRSVEEILDDFNDIPGQRDNEQKLQNYFTPLRLRNLIK